MFPLNPRFLLSLQETPYNNKNLLTQTKHCAQLLVKSLVGFQFHQLYSTTKGSFLVKEITEYFLQQGRKTYMTDIAQIYTLTSILLEGGLIQISLSHWTPPCPGVASELPQTAGD